MQIHQDYDHQRYAIRAYEAGRLTLIAPLGEVPETLSPEALERMQEARRQVVEAHVVVTGGALFTDWGPSEAQALEEAHLERLYQRLDAAGVALEVLILGTGPRQHFPHPRHILPFTRRGIGVEVMDTAAACRTYNFLSSDGRQVAAALFL